MDKIGVWALLAAVVVVACGGTSERVVGTPLDSSSRAGGEAAGVSGKGGGGSRAAGGPAGKAGASSSGSSSAGAAMSTAGAPTQPRARGGDGSAGDASQAGGAGGEGPDESGANAGAPGDYGTAGAGGAAQVETVCDKAHGTITLKPYTLFADGETFTLSDGMHDRVVFEVDIGGDGVASATRRAVVFEGTEDQTTMAAIIEETIRAARELGVLDVNTTLEGTTIGLDADRAGALGNMPIAETVANPNFEVSGFAGGAAVNCMHATCNTDAECAVTCDPVHHVCAELQH